MGGAAWPFICCVAGNCVTQLAICLFKINAFKMDALVIKSLTLGIYITIKKVNVRHYIANNTIQFLSKN